MFHLFARHSIRCVVAGMGALGMGMPGLVLACDAPGTPNQEELRPAGHRQLIYSFENTARGGGDFLKVQVWFDINMKENGTPPNQDWSFRENDGPHALGNHERIAFPVSVQQTEHINPANRRAERVNRSLIANRVYCMRVWSRMRGDAGPTNRLLGFVPWSRHRLPGSVMALWRGSGPTSPARSARAPAGLLAAMRVDELNFTWEAERTAAEHGWR
jgi:hypothetical protein